MKHIFILIIAIMICSGNRSSVEIAVLKYRGGGDWYANPTSLTNLISFCNNNIKTKINPNYKTVEVSSQEIFHYPFIHMTGHGNVIFNQKEANNLRNYLIAGGFLHIDDNYGLDPFIRSEIKKVFPEINWVELPFSHPIYHQNYSFNNGLPKIHQHDNKPPQGFGLFYKGRLVCFYSYESDLGDGWEDASVHGDSDHIRNKALEMGANIIQFVFLNND